MALTKNDKDFNFEAGVVLLIDKPLTWTSFDVVKRLRNVLSKKLRVKKLKVGHAGTLDPLATGLLIVCIGKATKQISQLQEGVKTYTGVFSLGATTPSYDLETEVNQIYPISHITKEQIEQVRKQFIGPQMQTPPIFSALKKDGKRAYELARKGKEVELQDRAIVIDDFQVAGLPPELRFEVQCSKGTYIRSLASDFGKSLNSGAYLKELRRTKIGEHAVEDAWQLDDFVKFIVDADI